MAQHAALQLSAKDAVACAFREFHDLFLDTAVEYVLLEGVEYDETGNLWIVTIGFDIGRKNRGHPLLGQGDQPLREKRKLYIDGTDGRFLRMT